MGLEEPVEHVNGGALWDLALGLESRREAWARRTEVGAPSLNSDGSQGSGWDQSRSVWRKKAPGRGLPKGEWPGR